jgi:hypothetical protein
VGLDTLRLRLAAAIFSSPLISPEGAGLAGADLTGAEGAGLGDAISAAAAGLGRTAARAPDRGTGRLSPWPIGVGLVSSARVILAGRPGNVDYGVSACTKRNEASRAKHIRGEKTTKGLPPGERQPPNV